MAGAWTLKAHRLVAIVECCLELHTRRH